MNDQKKCDLHIFGIPGRPFTSENLKDLDNVGIHPMSWEYFFTEADRFPELGLALSNDLILFLTDYAKSLSASKILVCEPLSGVIPTAMIKEGAAEEVTCLGWDNEPYDSARWLTEGLSVKWILGSPPKDIHALDDKFDVVFYLNDTLNKSVGLKKKEGDKPAFRPNKFKTIDLLHQLLSKLKPEGEGIFILPNLILWDKESRFIEELTAGGFFIHNIMEITQDVITPETYIPLSAFFISRKRISNPIISYYDPYSDMVDTLIQDISDHKEGKKSDYYEEFEARDFRFWMLYLNNLDLSIEAKNSGVNFVFLRHISKGITRGRIGKPLGGFSEQPNCIYLPSIGNSPAVTRLSDLKIKPHNYYQIILDESQAFSEYVASYFNTPGGLKIRKNIESWNFIPTIPEYNLIVAPILLPSINKQIDIINLLNDIQNIKLNLDAQEKMLWAEPKKIESIRREIRRFDRKGEELINEWIESLPFPVASILRRYKSDADPRSKVDHLLHFFEAFAQFNTTLLLSAYFHDSECFQKHKNEWIDPVTDFYRNKRASFGNWVTIGERIAKFTRSQMSTRDKQVDITDLFHTKNRYLLNLVSNKDLYQVFRNTNIYRNDWSGHGGVSGNTEINRRLALLEKELTIIRELVKDIFTDFVLIQPKMMTLTRGVFHNIVTSLMGSNSLFPEINIETNIGLDIDELYFIDRSRNDPLKLIRFFRMLPSPQSEQNACYFYSRFDPQGIRYVSYHFETQSERDVEDDGLVEFFDRLFSQ